MRHWITLIESSHIVDREFYFHITPARNYESIKKHGLIPNHNGGNYDDIRWESLEGVYASHYAKQLSDYLSGHLITDFLIIVIEVDTSEVLPDEDLIDIIFDHTLDAILHSDGITMDDPEFEDMAPGEEPFENTVGRLTKGFHDTAAGKLHIEMNYDLIHDAAEIWLEMKLGIGGDGPMMWKDIKDKIVHTYPKMVHPKLGTQHSVRIPKTIGFEGSTRIVAIIHAEDDNAPVMLFNNVPEEAKDKVNAFVEELLY